MHDMDRTQLEFENGMDEFENDEYGFMGEGEFEGEYEYMGESQGVFSEADEMELAAELLEITDEEELDQFIGSLVRRAKKAVGGAIKGPIGGFLKNGLKGIVRQGLPVLGGALGSFIAPGAGTALGSKLGSTAGSLFGLELEGMSAEDQEFEVARQMVRLGGEAVRQAASMPPTANPQAATQQALKAAAQQHAPGLVGRSTARRNSTYQNGARQRTRGVWTRRGGKIILHGL